jgi:hypothetical protein
MTYGNETQTEGSPKTVWATIGAPKHLQRRNKPSGTRTHEGLRSEGVDKSVQGESADDWISRHKYLVAGTLNGNAKNQRRVRYFGFETTHE